MVNFLKSRKASKKANAEATPVVEPVEAPASEVQPETEEVEIVDMKIDPPAVEHVNDQLPDYDNEKVYVLGDSLYPNGAVEDSSEKKVVVAKKHHSKAPPAPHALVQAAANTAPPKRRRSKDDFFESLGDVAIAINGWINPIPEPKPADDAEEEKEAEKHDVVSHPSNDSIVYGGIDIAGSSCAPTGAVTNFLEAMVMGNKALPAPAAEEPKEEPAFEQAPSPAEPATVVDEPIVDIIDGESNDSGAETSGDEEEVKVLGEIENTPRTAKKQAKEEKKVQKRIKKDEKAKTKKEKREKKAAEKAAEKKAIKEKKAEAKIAKKAPAVVTSPGVKVAP